jgi:hypothetical protein
MLSISKEYKMTDDIKNPEVVTDRNSRSAETRDSQTRSKPWTPPSMLDAPTPPPGYKFRWIREATRGQDDKSNMSKRIREGYEPVRAEDYPDFEAPSLAKVPEETAKSRNDYFTQQAKTEIDGVDQNLMRESDPRMPLNKSDIKRTSKVEFGSRNNSNE